MKELPTNVAYFGGTVAIAVLVMAFVVKAMAQGVQPKPEHWLLLDPASLDWTTAVSPLSGMFWEFGSYGTNKEITRKSSQPKEPSEQFGFFLEAD